MTELTFPIDSSPDSAPPVMLSFRLFRVVLSADCFVSREPIRPPTAVRLAAIVAFSDVILFDRVVLSPDCFVSRFPVLVPADVRFATIVVFSDVILSERV